MDQALEQFLQHLVVERGLAPLTVEAYAHDLTGLAAFLKAAGPGTVELPLPWRTCSVTSGIWSSKAWDPAAGPENSAPSANSSGFCSGKTSPPTIPWNGWIHLNSPKVCPKFWVWRKSTACWPRPTRPRPWVSGMTPCWSCSMPPASGFPNWWASPCPSLISPGRGPGPGQRLQRAAGAHGLPGRGETAALSAAHSPGFAQEPKKSKAFSEPQPATG